MTTSRKSASLASKILQSGKSAKAVAASDLSQRKGGSKNAEVEKAFKTATKKTGTFKGKHAG